MWKMLSLLGHSDVLYHQTDIKKVMGLILGSSYKSFIEIWSWNKIYGHSLWMLIQVGKSVTGKSMGT